MLQKVFTEKIRWSNMLERFYSCFVKGGNFCFLNSWNLSKVGLLIKEIVPRGRKFFLLRVTPNENEGKKFHVVVISVGDVYSYSTKKKKKKNQMYQSLALWVKFAADMLKYLSYFSLRRQFYRKFYPFFWEKKIRKISSVCPLLNLLKEW